MIKITNIDRRKIRKKVKENLSKLDNNNSGQEIFNRILEKLFKHPKEGDYNTKQKWSYINKTIKSVISDYITDKDKRGRGVYNLKTPTSQRKEDDKPVKDFNLSLTSEIEQKKEQDDPDFIYDFVDYYNTPERVLEVKELKEKIEKALEKLPPAQRDVGKLHFEGYERKEIAEKLNMKIGAVYTNLSRARDNMELFMEWNTEEFWKKY